MSLDLKNRQNTERALQRFAAQSQLYTDAKRIFAADSLLTAILPAIGAFAGLICTDIHSWSSFATFALWWVVFFALEPCRKKRCKAAAALQEDIDADLLQLPASREVHTTYLSREAIIAAADRYFQAHDDKNLKSWYPEDSDALPKALARIVCQRSNVWWDTDLRVWYSRICLWAVVIIACVPVLIGFIANSPVRTVAASWLIPLAPLMFLLGRQARSNQALAIKKSALIAETEALWRLALAEPSEEDRLTNESRKLQDSIYRLRAEPDLVWDWLYRLMRPKHEKLMRVAASELVKEAQTALAHKRTSKHDRD
jgi:hypothetical protein